MKQEIPEALWAGSTHLTQTYPLSSSSTDSPHFIINAGRESNKFNHRTCTNCASTAIQATSKNSLHCLFLSRANCKQTMHAPSHVMQSARTAHTSTTLHFSVRQQLFPKVPLVFPQVIKSSQFPNLKTPATITKPQNSTNASVTFRHHHHAPPPTKRPPNYHFLSNNKEGHQSFHSKEQDRSPLPFSRQPEALPNHALNANGCHVGFIGH